jgi:hypothetical protein
MAATAAPYGARPVGALSAKGSFVGPYRHIKIAASYNTAIFYGDFVKLANTGTIQKDAGTTTLRCCGIFMGCAYTDPTTNQYTVSQQWPASNAATDAVAYVLDDPDVLMQMQADGTVAQTGLGNNFAVAPTVGSTAIGTSKNAVDADSLATTTTLPLRLIDFVDGPDSAVGDAYTDLIVKFNTDDLAANNVGHQYRLSTGT